MPYRDPADKRKHNRRYQPQYYENNKHKIRERARKRRRDLRKWFDNLRRTLSCSRCGLSGEDMPWALEFHHRIPAEKEALVSWLGAQGYGKERIQREIDKCEVICANCHRKHHWEEAQAKKAKGEPSMFQEHGTNQKTKNPDGRPIGSYREARGRRRKKNQQKRADHPNPDSMPGPKPSDDEALI